jgi:hypothetical protein
MARTPRDARSRSARDTRRRSQFLPPVVVVVLTIATFAMVTLLMQRADSARSQQLRATSVSLALAVLQSAPLNSGPGTAGTRATARQTVTLDVRTISRGLSDASGVGASSSLLAGARQQLAEIKTLSIEITQQPSGFTGL